MNEDEWKDGLERLEAILTDAKDTHEKSKKDIEELEFTISNYKLKIESFK